MDRNIELRHQTVRLAEPYGATVEAELGLVGGGEVVDDSKTAESVLTEPEDVIRFVEESGVDILAVSIGTSHGMYKQRPVLDIPRLERLNAVSRVPLVMHGGSGTPDDQIQEAIRHGICKLNIYADNRIAMWNGFKAVVAEATRPDPPPVDYFAKVRTVMAQTVQQKMELCLSTNR
jgi:fructose-bisphosphate aldolase class II